MPKVKINNAQGLVQETGGGVALFSAIENITSTSATVQAQFTISPTTSVALLGGGGGTNRMIGLPATGSLSPGHTIVLVNTGSSAASVRVEPSEEQGYVNNIANAKFNIAKGDSSICVYSGTNRPGWIVIQGSADETPS